MSSCSTRISRSIQSSLADHAAFPLPVGRVAKPDIGRGVAGAPAMVQMGGLGERVPRQLAGGQEQRVVLARARVFRRGLLLRDEPLGALDKNLREQMQL